MIADQSDSFRPFQLADWSIPFRVAGYELVNSNVVKVIILFREVNVKKRRCKVKKDNLAEPSVLHLFSVQITSALYICAKSS